MALDISDIPTLLVIAGIVFLFIAIVRNISGTVATTIDRKSATILGISGVILLALGLITAHTGTFLPSDTIDTIPPLKQTPIPPISTPYIMEDISPLPTYVIKNTSTGSGIIRLEQRGEKIYVEIVIYEEGKKKGPYFFSAPPPPPTITETPEPTPTSSPTETPIHTLTPEQQTE